MNLKKLKKLKESLLSLDCPIFNSLEIGQKVELINGFSGEITELDPINNRLRVKTIIDKEDSGTQMPEYDLIYYTPDQINKIS